MRLDTITRARWTSKRIGRWRLAYLPGTLLLVGIMLSGCHIDPSADELQMGTGGLTISQQDLKTQQSQLIKDQALGSNSAFEPLFVRYFSHLDAAWKNGQITTSELYDTLQNKGHDAQTYIAADDIDNANHVLSALLGELQATAGNQILEPDASLVVKDVQGLLHELDAQATGSPTDEPTETTEATEAATDTPAGTTEATETVDITAVLPVPATVAPSPEMQIEAWALHSEYVSSDPCSGAATVDVIVPVSLAFDEDHILVTLTWYSRVWTMQAKPMETYTGTAVVEQTENQSIIDVINLAFISPQKFEGDMTRTVTTGQHICTAYYKWHGSR